MLSNLFEVFSERDPARRLKVIESNYTEDVIWSDPDGTIEGREAMANQAQKLIDRISGLMFSAAGPVHVSRDLGFLAFNLAAPGQPPTVSGFDVGLVREGRIAVLHTLLSVEPRTEAQP